jgi:hypothetical protein
MAGTTQRGRIRKTSVPCASCFTYPGPETYVTKPSGQRTQARAVARNLGSPQTQWLLLRASLCAYCTVPISGSAISSQQLGAVAAGGTQRGPLVARRMGAQDVSRRGRGASRPRLGWGKHPTHFHLEAAQEQRFGRASTISTYHNGGPRASTRALLLVENRRAVQLDLEKQNGPSP